MNFQKKLVRNVSEEAGCGIQHGGCPCNKCFHTWAEDELKLSGNFSHLFWLVVLALRGDYTEKELIKGNKDLFKELSKI